mmetsp:Transcript_93052/g.199571  ORF Transcript_93052/g.199571 Transcript_93052/m.199571 type:complete len:248 (+) Transcript_93052:498-1241(+)
MLTSSMRSRSTTAIPQWMCGCPVSNSYIHSRFGSDKSFESTTPLSKSMPALSPGSRHHPAALSQGPLPPASSCAPGRRPHRAHMAQVHRGAREASALSPSGAIATTAAATTGPANAPLPASSTPTSRPPRQDPEPGTRLTLTGSRGGAMDAAPRRPALHCVHRVTTPRSTEKCAAKAAAAIPGAATAERLARRKPTTMQRRMPRACVMRPQRRRICTVPGTTGTVAVWHSSCATCPHGLGGVHATQA